MWQDFFLIYEKSPFYTSYAVNQAAFSKHLVMRKGDKMSADLMDNNDCKKAYKFT